MIVRGEHKANFTVVPNALILDQALTYEAIGLLVSLLSRPSDWRVSVAQIASEGGIGRDKAYALIKLQTEAGYVRLDRPRDPRSKAFGPSDYVVLDVAHEPLPEKPEVADSQEIEPLPEKPYPANQDAYKEQKVTKAFQEGSAPDGAGADAPQVPKIETGILPASPSPPLPSPSAKNTDAVPATTSALIWREGRALLADAGPKRDGLIGKWFRRAASEADRVKLLGMIRSAVKAGTGDPASYVIAALNMECPPPPDPKTFDRDRWRINVMAATKTGSWAPTWGPPPGKPKCICPPDLITPELTRALATRRIAA